MQRLFSHTGLGAADRGATAALGNFDGVHLGHCAVIETARRAAEAPLGVVTFEPHPRSFFAPGAPPFRLMNAEARANRLRKLGVEKLYELPFDAEMAGMTAEAFVAEVLVDGLGLTHVVVGADFRFGKGRTGDAALLIAEGQAHGLGVTIAPLLADQGGDYSSSAIRTALAEGRPEAAARMLGHWHRIEGVVEQGDQRGRDLGYPTANLSLDALHRPAYGVYAVWVDVLDGPHIGRYGGAASIGERPTFGVNRPNLEVFLLDFAGDLYGARLSVALVAFQRGEIAFDGIAPLIAQMDADVIETRRILAETPASATA